MGWLNKGGSTDNLGLAPSLERALKTLHVLSLTVSSISRPAWHPYEVTGLPFLQWMWPGMPCWVTPEIRAWRNRLASGGK